MSTISDPELRAARHATQHAARHGFQSAYRAPLAAVDSPVQLRAKRSGVRSILYGTLAGIAAFAALQLFGSLFAEPLVMPSSAAAPAWKVEVTTNSNSSGLVLAYGREVGVQILRIPPRGAKGDDARIIPARLARGELHLLTLHPGSLHVEAPGAPRSGVFRVSANGPVVTLFQSPRMSGIRTGF